MAPSFASSFSSDRPGLAISWVLATISGYGNYGLQIVLQHLRRGGGQVVLGQAPATTELPPLTMAQLAPIYALAHRLHAHRRAHPDELLSFKHAALHGCSSDFAGFAGQDKIWGQPNVGCCAIEHLVTTSHGRAIAKNYDMFIAISQWNADYLNSLGLHGPTHLCYQGIDPTLFAPGPRAGLYSNRFVIFSGGKFEFRKGQDIVVAAYKRFRALHPDALLVTCWQNLLYAHALPFRLAGHAQEVPAPAKEYGIELTSWLLAQGLPADSFVDLPFTHNLVMPWVLRECDVAIFPNRCEGGTNLVAMEAMACGVPTYVSYNTGQKDIVDRMGAHALRSQRPVKASPEMNTVQDWGETDVDEVVEALETAYTKRAEQQARAAEVAAGMRNWAWGALNEKLLRIVCDGAAA